MWFFNRDSFPYTIGTTDDSLRFYSVFSLNDGTKKYSGETVSIFTYVVREDDPLGLEHARTAVKKLKTLRHPSILTYIDSYEDEHLIHLVTEHVVPLLSFKEKIKGERVEDIYMKWGLKAIGEAVAFLFENSMRHNNVFHGSVFVDDTGTWKLGEFGYISSLSAPYPQKVKEFLRKYDIPKYVVYPKGIFPKEDEFPIRPTPTPLWSVDFWGLGILMWETFNGELKNKEALENPKKIPSPLSEHYLQFMKMRDKEKGVVAEYILSCSENNLLLHTMDSLLDYHLKDKDVKAKIYHDLVTIIPGIPKDLKLKKILPLLKSIHEFDPDNSGFLVPVISKMSFNLTKEEFQNYIEYFILTLFLSNDRATRLALLTSIQDLINKISQKCINDLFRPLATGFLDSNPKIRGETVKAMLYFAPKLSKKLLNDDALRFLVQLQTKDPEPFIRTNTTILLGRIATFLQPESRKKILLNALLHALRDPCPLVRHAGAHAFAATHKYFPLETIARNILPALVCLTVDADSTVRVNAFMGIKAMLSKLEKYSNSPELKDELEKDVTFQASENLNLSWSGWALSALTSKFISKKSDSDEKCNSKDDATSESSLESAITVFVEEVKPDPTEVPVPKPESEDDKKKENDDKKNDEGDDSDWEDEAWGEAYEEVLTPTERRIAKKYQESKKKTKSSSGPMKLGTRSKKL